MSTNTIQDRPTETVALTNRTRARVIVNTSVGPVALLEVDQRPLCFVALARRGWGSPNPPHEYRVFGLDFRQWVSDPERLPTAVHKALAYAAGELKDSAGRHAQDLAAGMGGAGVSRAKLERAISLADLFRTEAVAVLDNGPADLPGISPDAPGIGDEPPF